MDRPSIAPTSGLPSIDTLTSESNSPESSVAMGTTEGMFAWTPSSHAEQSFTMNEAQDACAHVRNADLASMSLWTARSLCPFT
jgi:hypothetical protein